MNTTQNLSRNFDAIGWGALFIWWGVSMMFPSLPNGITTIGTGLILIGVNIARKLTGLPIDGFSAAIGILAFVWGALEIAGVLIHFPYELPIFAILLIVLGLIILAPELRSKHTQS